MLVNRIMQVLSNLFGLNKKISANDIAIKNNIGKAETLDTYLNGMIKVIDVATDKYTLNTGNRCRGSVDVPVPDGYKIISIMPCYTTNGDRNFVDYNLYYENNRIYYEIYCQYATGVTGNSNFRVVIIKENI